MDHFIDVTVQPSKEYRENWLLNQTYSRLHQKLVAGQISSIGVSFPEYRLNLGRRLRLHGTAQDLAQVIQGLDFTPFGACVKLSTVSPVPTSCHYRTVSRKQPTMSPAKMRRLVKRGSLTEAEAQSYRKKLFTKGLSDPYVELESGSSQHKYRRYIIHGALQENAVSGSFDTFGLSKEATVPWF